MAIRNLDESEFVSKLRHYLSPSKPIASIELLHGRSSALRKIEKALHADCRNIFIYGDRGVGKSSLAQTAATQYQSADNNFVLVECCRDSTFFGIVESVARKATNNALRKVEQSRTTKLSVPVLSHEITKKTTTDHHALGSIKSIDHASDVIDYIGKLHSEKPIVVIDEFDAIESQKERELFSIFIKHLGDKNINVKFIFAGIAQSLETLLGAHLSSIRQFETIKLERLSWDARWEIVEYAAQGLGLEITKEFLIRIAGISDGFPYYVHLIAEKLFWHLFENEHDCATVTIEDYYQGINDAIEAISPHLKHPYDKATLARDLHYHYVLWAMADAYDLHRNTNNIYKSYQSIMEADGEVCLDRTAFLRRLNSLKQKSSDFILVGVAGRMGWYQFRESMVRGYVRLVAESNGIELKAEAADEPKMPSAFAGRQTPRHIYRAPAGAPRGLRR